MIVAAIQTSPWVNNIIALVSNPYVWVGFGCGLTLLVCYYVFAAYVGSLDVPPQGTPEHRRWKFLNLLAANFKRAAKAGHIPVAETQVMTEEEVKKMTAGGGQ